MASKSIGDYLLSGWTMLAEHCEKCLIPIMEKNDEKICVKCENSPQEKKPEIKESKEVKKTPIKEIPS